MIILRWSNLYLLNFFLCLPTWLGSLEWGRKEKKFFLRELWWAALGCIALFHASSCFFSLHNMILFQLFYQILFVIWRVAIERYLNNFQCKFQIPNHNLLEIWLFLYIEFCIENFYIWCYSLLTFEKYEWFGGEFNVLHVWKISATKGQ